MPNSITIRPAEPRDCAVICALIKELSIYEKLEHEAKATPAQLETHLFGADVKARALMAEVDSRPAGFALYFYNFSTFVGKPGIYLEDLFVRPDYRSHGIGKMLLQKLASIAVAENCGRLEWWVLDWNTPAIGFYKKIGARAMDEWTVYRVDGDALKALAQ